MMKSLLSSLCFALLIGNTVQAQSAPTTPQASEPIAYSSVNELNQLLTQVQQFSDSAQSDLGKLRIERWKTDSTTRRQTQANVDSLTRNLHDALPEMMSALRSAPENLAATFKLYRNLDALYDVLSTVVESAGAFGTKDDFQSLNNDFNVLEQSRRAFADRMASLSTAKETEIVNLRTKVQQAQASATTAPPAKAVKKTVVDDTVPAKSTSTKTAKKKVPKPTPPANADSSSTPTPAPANPN